MSVDHDPVQALVLVDVQQAFVTGPEAVPAREQLLSSVGELLDRARAAGALVVQLQNDGPPGAVDEPHRPGWDLYFPSLESEREFVIRKVEDDGFAGTPLEAVLRRHGVSRIAIGGVMSEMCVLSTAAHP